jgi:LysR family carnitine catabolism transcriptional activator
MDAAVRHFKAFLAIVRLGNFTRAAAALHMSQSALTVQVRQLEEALGVRLFDRNRRQVAITRTGRALLTNIERLVADIDALFSGSQKIAQLKRGAVSIAALPSVASSFLPRAIQRFTNQYPDIAIRVHDVVAKQIIHMVEAEDVDFGIGSLIGKKPGPDRERK